MSPATVRYPSRDIKLLLVNDRKRKCSYWLHPLINSGNANLASVFYKFLPKGEVGSDPVYFQIYRHFKALERLGYVRLSKGKSGDMGEQPGIWCVPTDLYITLLSRMQNSNHFYENAKSRRDMGQFRQDQELTKMQSAPGSCKCPYRVSSRTKGTRLDAIFQLRRISQHRKFQRRDKRVVNPELVRDLDYVQGKFENYVEDIADLKCALINREDGHIRLIDYQTRFTDESRKDGVIARFYRTVEKATASYNSGVFLTLTSYPPSEGSRLQHRTSLWHVNRYFARTWNAYISLLQKRKRSARRDELLDVMRSRVKKVRGFRTDEEGKVKLTREERTEALKPMREENFRPKYLMVYEFQKNGMIHGHCVIFGTQWLDSFEQIKADWQRLGQGERIHVYGIKNEGAAWQWSKGQPQDSRNRSPVDYLMKYLGKGVRLSQGHGMYWAINKRFFTSSQALKHDNDLPVEMEKFPTRYDFLGTLKGDDIPVWLIMRNRARTLGQRSAGEGWLDPLGWANDTPRGSAL
jgi:hypothetical protein